MSDYTRAVNEFENAWSDLKRGYFDRLEDYDLEAIHDELRDMCVTKAGDGWKYEEAAPDALGAIVERHAR